MEKNKSFIIWFQDLGINDVPLVGGKNAALGEMYSNLSQRGVNIPNGFAITAHAYRYFLEEAGLKNKIREALTGLDTGDIHGLRRRGKAARSLVLSADLPQALELEISSAYEKLGKNKDVAVRSSATAEDLPGASFAGQQETYLNIVGQNAVLLAVKKCIASLFTDRAISYRVDKGFSHFDAALSVGVQEMVRSDQASSGVNFTIDTETGFDKVIIVTAVYGLGEMIVQGKVTPDEFLVFKPTLEQGFAAIIGQDLGRKDIKLVYSSAGTKVEKVSRKDAERFCVSKEEVLTLARWSVIIEKYFSEIHGRYQPMDIEWAKDGRSGKLYIVQARPETIHSIADKNVYKEYVMSKSPKPILVGTAVGSKIAQGTANIILSAKKIDKFRKGEILITEITDPDWEPIMKIASAIVTDKGGRTSHAAIVSRELGIPCIVGSERATRVLKPGKEYTVDCSSGNKGNIYAGKVPFNVNIHHLQKMPKTKTEVMINIGDPDEAFENHYLPTKGVGLGRLEFIIASHIKIHPNALLNFSNLKKSKKFAKLAKEIDALTPGYSDKAQFYIDELAEGIAKIGAAFWPHDVVIRFSDFKTNEYRKLVGGELYEPEEENPMIGWRGASRYYDPKFKKAFGLECVALRKVREVMGLKNVIPMIPFCRTPEEGKAVVETMKEHGLDRAKDKTLKIYVMCEIPSNIILADEFLDIFDGMSIGSNDLTQLVLGLDRDSNIINHIGNENSPAVKKMIEDVIKKCVARGKYVGICGQAPSDHPGFAEFLIKLGIKSISLNPDTIIKILPRIEKAENEIK